MKTQEMIKMLKKFDSCKEAIEFTKNYESFEAAWNACQRGDWMLWIAQRLKVDHRKLTLAKALCAETVIHLMRDERSRKAVEVAKKYGNYKASQKDLTDATAYAAAVADDAAAAAVAKENNQKQTADICRKILTDEVLKKIN
ncbi:MAG: hypothetical protein K9J21_07215 [Bacteroidales bacterium]|nr:hypothetical protein [Bacteroidales bacterium]